MEGGNLPNGGGHKKHTYTSVGGPPSLRQQQPNDKHEQVWRAKRAEKIERADRIERAKKNYNIWSEGIEGNFIT